ncbi:MAG: hypothetical protein IJU23_10200 [Proteobacteria bacterium]|nr:hypothetical protein [Pseudomonadota bacterium]
MQLSSRLTVLCLTIFALMLLGCATSGTKETASAKYWNSHKGDCDQILLMPHGYSLTQVAYCTKMWETYRYVNDLEIKDRSKYAVAFSTVSHKSTDPYEKLIADVALARVCIPRHPMKENGEIREEIPDRLDCKKTTVDMFDFSGQGMDSTNPFLKKKRKKNIPDISPNDIKASTAAYKKANDARYSKKSPSIAKAIGFYNEALDANPYNVEAKYALASALAVENEERDALYHLEEMYTWNSSQAEAMLAKAAKDPDFENIRDNPNFKLLTGFAHIVLINGATKIGFSQVDIIRKKLKAKSIVVSEIARSERIEIMPQIWYREGFEDQAEQIKNILNFRNVSFQRMRVRDEPADIMIVWGQPEATAFGAGQTPPVVQGVPPKGSKNYLDDTLKGIEDQKKAADNLQGSAEGAVDSAKK